MQKFLKQQFSSGSASSLEGDEEQFDDFLQSNVLQDLGGDFLRTWEGVWESKSSSYQPSGRRTASTLSTPKQSTLERLKSSAASSPRRRGSSARSPQQDDPQHQIHGLLSGETHFDEARALLELTAALKESIMSASVHSPSSSSEAGKASTLRRLQASGVSPSLLARKQAQSLWATSLSRAQVPTLEAKRVELAKLQRLLSRIRFILSSLGKNALSLEGLGRELNQQSQTNSQRMDMSQLYRLPSCSTLPLVDLPCSTVLTTQQ